MDMNKSTLLCTQDSKGTAEVLPITFEFWVCKVMNLERKGMKPSGYKSLGSTSGPRFDSRVGANFLEFYGVYE